MSMNEHGEWPDGSFAHGGPLKPIYVWLDAFADNALLRLARIADDTLEWPGLNSNQRQAVAGIRVIEQDGGRAVSIPPRVNLDFFVDDDTDEEAPPFWTGRASDLQRYYTRFTDTQFLHVGTFTAITIDGVRRYFMWQSDGWKEIGLRMFLYYRDDDETHFAETDRGDIEKLNPGALDVAPVRSASAEPEVTGDNEGEDEADEDWTLEEFVAMVKAADDAAGDLGDEGHDVDDDDEATGADDDDTDDDEDLMSEVDAMVQHGRASAIATIAHRGQVDKLGYDYIDHPARVSEAFDWLDEPVAHCTAWLHDVIEDSDITAKDLIAAGMVAEIVEVVELLTRRGDVADEVYYERIRVHPTARAVKLADIADNEAEWRFRKLDYDTQVRLSHKYFEARELLERESE